MVRGKEEGRERGWKEGSWDGTDGWKMNTFFTWSHLSFLYHRHSLLWARKQFNLTCSPLDDDHTIAIASLYSGTICIKNELSGRKKGRKEESRRFLLRRLQRAKKFTSTWREPLLSSLLFLLFLSLSFQKLPSLHYYTFYKSMILYVLYTLLSLFILSISLPESSLLSLLSFL